jgi:hypothetical protein
MDIKNKEELIALLSSYYKNIKREHKQENYEIIIEDLFGIDNIRIYLEDIIEESYKDFMLFGANKDMTKEIFAYTDDHDFLNTIIGVEPNDLSIFMKKEAIAEYTMDLINMINKAIVGFMNTKRMGYRKGTKIFLEKERDNQIKLKVRLDLKF